MPNPYTLGDLKAELQPILWPTGEAENLVIAHNQFFIEALIDLQQWVECLQINNVQVYPQCNTLFKCGLTVLDAPRGRINRLYTLDRVNQTTGLEDPAVPLDWCSFAEYRQVDYSDLDEFVSQALANTWNGGFLGWFAGLFYGWPISSFIACPNVFSKKFEYPPPTDEGLTNAPPLPMGYHYPQSSTDAPVTQRAQFGLWAKKGAQIFVAPWIQSTETIIVEWDGLKHDWTDGDIVDNDPKFKKAVKEYILWQQALHYDRDFDLATKMETSYKLTLAELMYECREENRIKEANFSSKATGASTVLPTFFNSAQQATASCPDGTTGNSVTVTVPANSVISYVSVADANSRAQSMALQQAGQQLQCTAVPPSWTNTSQSYTANCTGGGTGQPVTVNIAAGQFTSTVSQADANAQALTASIAQANSQLVCTWTNTAQTFNGTCPSGGAISHTTAAGTFTSSISQADANAQALQAAQNAALATCPSGVYFNTQITVTASITCVNEHHIIGETGIVSGSSVVPANTVSSTVSQQDAQNQAYLFGYPLAIQNARFNCVHNGGVPQ